MPTYEYACKSCGEHLEIVQAFTDDSLTTCPACGGPLRKVFGNIGISFKGSGFYKNDSRSTTSSTSPASASDNGSGAKDGSGSKEGSETKNGSGAKDGSGGDSSSTKESSPAPAKDSKPAPASSTPAKAAAS